MSVESNVGIETTDLPSGTAEVDLAQVLEAGHLIIRDAEGRPVAAVVPVAVLQELVELRELLEDCQDGLASCEAELEQLRSGEPPRDWEEVKAELDALDAAENGE